MNNSPENRKRADAALNRMVRQGATGQNQPDETNYVVLIDGQPHLIGQQRNDMINSRTVKTFVAQTTDGGTTFPHIRDVVVTTCGCRCARTDQLFVCHYCNQIVCARHATLWREKGIAFCNSPACVAKARIHQFSHYGTKLLSFSLKSVFGFESDGQCTKSGSLPIRQIENEARVRASEREAEDENRQK